MATGSRPIAGTGLVGMGRREESSQRARLVKLEDSTLTQPSPSREKARQKALCGTLRSLSKSRA